MLNPKPLMPEITVNGERISSAAIAAEAQNHHAPKGKPGLAWRAAARALVIRTLMLQEARRRGLEPAPRELAPGRIESDDEALMRQLLEAAVEPAAPGAAELRAAYEAGRERFRSPALYEAAHILVAAPPNARDAARAKAESMLAAVQADPAAFERLAHEESACSSRANGGRIGQISSGDTVPEFEAALARIPEGTVGLVKTRYGFHIVRLDARAEGAALPFEAVRADLRTALQKLAWTRAARAFVSTLIERADITGIDLELAKQESAVGGAGANCRTGRAAAVSALPGSSSPGRVAGA